MMSEQVKNPDILTAEELQDMLTLLPKVSDAEKRDILYKLELHEQAEKVENAQNNFIDFVHMVWPNFIDGAHHKRMAKAFERVARGEGKRLIINMPPRHTKSEFASYLLPAWFLGKFPQKKVIQTSHSGVAGR